MCKKSLLMMLLLALFAPWAANAQTSLFSEDFEDGSMPTGWTTDGPGTWQIGTGDYSTSTGAGNGTYNAKITHSSTGNVTKLITPEIDLSSVSSALLSFMHVQRSWAGDIDELRVYYRTSSSETWTLLTEYTAAFSTWTTEEDIVLPNTSSTYQIAFEYTDNYGYGVGIDYIQIVPPSSCARPTALASSNVTAHGATISWTSDASAWQVCLNDDENNLINVTTTSYTFSGLTAETTYSAKVRTNCNGTYSNWTTPVSFTTTVACPVPTLAYSGAVTNLTAHSGMVSWTENGSATEWVVAYKVTDETEFEEVTVTENPYVITNLVPETSYNVKVKAVCGGIDGESEWSYTRTFTTTVACPAPTNLQCTGSTLTTATLSWFEGEATQWEVCLNNDEANLYSVVGSPTITLNNLAPGTTYSFKVRAICDSASEWSSSYSFTTAFAIPLVQPFDATSIPAGWNMYTGLLGADGTATLTAATYGWSFGTNNGVFDSHARVNIYSNYQRWLVTPYLEMEDNVRLTFNLALTAYSGTVAAPQTTGTDDKFAVLITTDNGSTWEVLRQWDNAGSEYVYNNITCSAEGEFVNLDLSRYAGQTVAIAFYGESTVSNADNNLHIDNVTIEYIPSCDKPQNLTVNYTGGTEATISWESDATSFNVDVNGTVTNNVTNPYTITGLELATTYNVKVQAVCGAGNLSEWSNPVSFTTDLCMPENQCELTFALTDAWGDSWNGAYIDVVDVATGISLAHMTNQNLNGTSGSGENELNTLTLAVCDGREIQFVWHSGSYDSECSYVVTDVNGEEIFSGSGAMSEPVNYTMNCTVSNCRKPTDLATTAVFGRSAILNWTENGEATSWVVAYSPDGTGFREVDADAHPFTLEGLEPETDYFVKVRPVCDVDDKWSDVITFTTDVACAAPGNVAVSDIEPNSATVSWTGEAENYNLRYRELTAEDFATITLYAEDVWQDGTGYQLLLDADANTYGTIIPETGGLTSSGNASAATYAEFEYKIPVNADGAMNTTNVVIAESITIQVPAGTYDWCVTNPTPGDRIWIASANGNVGGRYDDYEFRGGNTYEFHVYADASTGNDAVDLTVTETGSAKDVVWTEINNVTSPYTLTVNPEKDYVVEVQANCGDDGTSAWAGTNFSTPSNCQVPTPLDVTDITAYTATLNWTGLQERFEVQYRTKGSRELLFFEDFDGQPSTWTLTNTVYNTTSSATTDYLAFIGSGSTETAYLITPDLTDIVSVGTVEFMQRVYNGTATFQVGFSSTTNDVDAFTWGEEVSAAAVMFTAYDIAMPAGTKYVAIKSTTETENCAVLINDFGIYGNEIPAGQWNTATANTTSCPISGLAANTEYEWQVRGMNEGCDGGYTEWCELVTFTTDVSCHVPTNVTVSDVTVESAVIAWTSEASLFDIDVNGVVTNDVTNPYTLEDLDPETIYTVKVRANCGDGDYSEWTTGVSFVTDCGGAKDVPYTYGFEDLGEYYACWSTYAEDGNNNTLGIGGYDDAYEGSNVFIFSSYTNYYTDYDQYLYSPELNAESDVAFEFYYRTPQGYGTETFEVGYSADGEEYTWSDEIATNTTEWTQYADTLPAGTKYVAIHYYSVYQYYLLVDAFKVEEVAPATITQTIELAEGTTWVSFNVDITLDNLKAAIVAALPSTTATATIASKQASVKYQRGRWAGQLNALDMTQMYMITVSSACEIVLEGIPVDPTTITIVPGANWIAYPFTTSSTPTTVFAGFAINDDVVRSKTQSAKYNRNRWAGQLNTLAPNQGYIYISADNADRPFTYPTLSKGGDKGVQSPMTTGHALNLKAKVKTSNLILHQPNKTDESFKSKIELTNNNLRISKK